MARRGQRLEGVKVAGALLCIGVAAGARAQGITESQLPTPSSGPFGICAGPDGIFAAAGTNVGMTITITDTKTGAQKIYTNLDGQAAIPIQDVNAFTCP
jgi:hypothetical protein